VILSKHQKNANKRMNIESASEYHYEEIKEQPVALIHIRASEKSHHPISQLHTLVYSNFNSSYKLIKFTIQCHWQIATKGHLQKV
jgi:hypothetical protein